MTDIEKAAEADAQVPVSPEQENDAAAGVHDMSKEQLVERLREILEKDELNAHKEVVAIKQALFAVRQREMADEFNAFVEGGNDPTAFASAPDPLEEEAKTLINTFRERRAAYLEAEEAAKKANLERKRAVIGEIHSLTEDIDNINLHFPKFQELQQAFKDAGDVPATDETAVWKEYQTVIEQFYDCLSVNKELRALDFKKNQEIKRHLIDEARALCDEEDVVDAARKLQQLHLEWRETGPVAKEIREEIWEEFKAASAVVNKRHQQYFEQRKAAEKENEDAKTVLCGRIEAIDLTNLGSFKDWEAAQEQIKELQAEWRKLGPASRKINNELYARFRKSCDVFFAAKAEYVKAQRESLQQNLARKTELCEKVEAMKENPEIKNPIDEVLKLQAEWKTIGGVGKKYSDEIWKRFMDACNYFFDARKKEQNSRRNEENANLEAKRAVIAKLNEIPLDSDVREGLKLTRELQKEWQEIGHVPFKQKDKIYAEYREVCDRLYDSFNQSREQERRRNFKTRLDNLQGDGDKLGRERDRLLRAIDQREQELKTYQNNLGFFNVKSNQGNLMVKEMEKRMERIKSEIQEIRAKIDLLDNPAE